MKQSIAGRTATPEQAQDAAHEGWRSGMGMRAGSPDIMLCWRGRFLATELKTSVGKLSEAQQEQHPLIRAAGADLATPRNVREFVAWLRGHGVPVAEEWRPHSVSG